MYVLPSQQEYRHERKKRRKKSLITDEKLRAIEEKIIVCA
jgi:hypothetical protein